MELNFKYADQQVCVQNMLMLYSLQNTKDVNPLAHVHLRALKANLVS